MHAFDFDGIIFFPTGPRVKLRRGDEIITGRSYEEAPETRRYLRKHYRFHIDVWFNPRPFHEKSRQSSALHKVKILEFLRPESFTEDDPVQAQIIRTHCPWLKLVHLPQDELTYENERRQQ